MSVDKPNREVKRRTSQPVRPLTRKQKAFVQEIVNNPKQSATKAALNTYNATYGTARQIATDNLANPSILAELAKYDQSAQNTIVEVMNHSKQRMTDSNDRDGSAWATVAKNTADSLLDRLHGKAKQQLDVTSTSVSFNINLTAEDTEA